MLPVAHGKFTTLQPSPMNWPNSLKQCAAICNSLNLVNQQRVVGDTADYTAFKACEARFLVSYTCQPNLKHLLGVLVKSVSSEAIASC